MLRKLRNRVISVGDTTWCHNPGRVRSVIIRHWHDKDLICSHVIVYILLEKQWLNLPERKKKNVAKHICVIWDIWIRGVYFCQCFVLFFFPLQTNWTHKSNYTLSPTWQHLNKPGAVGVLSYCTGIIIGPFKSIRTSLRWEGEVIKSGEPCSKSLASWQLVHFGICTSALNLPAAAKPQQEKHGASGAPPCLLRRRLLFFARVSSSSTTDKAAAFLLSTASAVWPHLTMSSHGRLQWPRSQHGGDPRLTPPPPLTPVRPHQTLTRPDESRDKTGVLWLQLPFYYFWGRVK